MEYIKIYYLPGLGDFLDEHGIKWHNNGDHTILIYYTEGYYIHLPTSLFRPTKDFLISNSFYPRWQLS